MEIVAKEAGGEEGSVVNVLFPPGAMFIITPSDMRQQSRPDSKDAASKKTEPEGILDWDSIGSAYIMKSLFRKET